ncbi:MAG: ATP-binding protein [Syntrophobacteraceae bacterium]|jgi:PAS domain S-box-containing protein
MTDEGAPQSFNRPMILVIDDEKRIRDGCTRALSGQGYEVATADSGELGLKMIEENLYDIILLDLMMPSLSGFDVLARVKTLHPDSVIIVISGYVTIENSIEAMKKGAFDFIPKPFTPEQLRLLVAKAIEYIQALQDIANEKTRMRVLIDQLTDGVMAVDMQKRVVLANSAFLQMSGCQRKDAVGCMADEVCNNSRIDGLIDKAISMPTDELTELSGELTLEKWETSLGSVVNARCVPFRDRRSRNVGAITVLHDITASKRMEQIKSYFVSMASHEVRGPLNAVMAQLNVVASGLAGQVNQDQKEILGRASEKIGAVLDLTTELLDLAKIESGLTSQEREEIDMAEIIEDQVAFHLAEAQAKQISLDLEPLPSLPPVVVNRGNMVEVLSNLIGNAIKYTAEGGKVVVSAGLENGYLKVSVRDNGIGIAQKELEKIFSPFYRVKNKKTRFIIGTGLGLSIVKSILEAHKGFISVDSAPGRGSTFHFFLPCNAS